MEDAVQKIENFNQILVICKEISFAQNERIIKKLWKISNKIHFCFVWFCRFWCLKTKCDTRFQKKNSKQKICRLLNTRRDDLKISEIPFFVLSFPFFVLIDGQKEIFFFYEGKNDCSGLLQKLYNWAWQLKQKNCSREKKKLKN